jgi:hypothetical protein
MTTREKYDIAFKQGFDAVAASPYHAPRNPYDSMETPVEYEGWEDGADQARLYSHYTNSILDRNLRC